MKKLAFLLVVGVATYWFFLRGGCGRGEAIACPAAALEEGVGEQLTSAEACADAGYLCAERRQFQVIRWPLTEGKLRVRVSLPPFLDKETGNAVRDVVIEGIETWDGHPFPLVIDASSVPLRLWDVEVVWTEGLYNASLGVSTYSAQINGKRVEFKSHGIAVVVPPIRANAPVNPDPATIAAGASYAMGRPLLARMKATAIHEMGHALGLGHSDSRGDIMFPYLREGGLDVRPSARDYRTVAALYELPNGATVR